VPTIAAAAWNRQEVAAALLRKSKGRATGCVGPCAACPI